MPVASEDQVGMAIDIPGNDRAACGVDFCVVPPAQAREDLISLANAQDALTFERDNTAVDDTNRAVG